MKIIVTCGPSYEPIDEVRRITNLSTGELGARLSNILSSAGFEVFCFKGSGATHPGPDTTCRSTQFDTNDDLLELLTQISESHRIDAVFHVAALCDYRVTQVENDRGDRCESAKIASRSGALTLSLEPATKVLSRMRALFPESLLIGWKYELVGTSEDAISKASLQMDTNDTDACVVNGRAFGTGFAFCRRNDPIRKFDDKNSLTEFLSAWLVEMLTERTQVDFKDGSSHFSTDTCGSPRKSGREPEVRDTGFANIETVSKSVSKE